MFNNWAEPVTNKKWAFVAVVLDRVKRMSGYRFFVASSHRAWQKAIGYGQ